MGVAKKGQFIMINRWNANANDKVSMFFFYVIL